MDNRAIGVFDSGLGGLTAVRRLHALMPQENIIILAIPDACPMVRADGILLLNMRVRTLRSCGSLT